LFLSISEIYFLVPVTKTAQFSTFSDFKECKLWSIPAKKMTLQLSRSMRIFTSRK